MLHGRPILVVCLLSAVLAVGCADSKRSGGGGGAGGAKSGGGCKAADRALVAAARAHPGPLRVGPAGDVDRLTASVCRTTDADATATVIVYGMRDKAIRDVRHEVRLIKVGGLWQVTGDLDTRRCQQGHGHQDFSGDLCH